MLKAISWSKTSPRLAQTEQWPYDVHTINTAELCVLESQSTYSIAIAEPFVAGEVTAFAEHGNTANSLVIDALLRELEGARVGTSFIAFGVESKIRIRFRSRVKLKCS